MDDRLFQYADVTPIGSILLGKNTVADGYQHGRKIGIFTHIHSDHTKYFTNALHECSLIYVSKPTLDLLAAMESSSLGNISPETYFKGRHIHALDFDTPIVPSLNTRELGSEENLADRITLFPTNHILGSSQVLVETDDQKKIVYSSDFADIEPHPNTRNCDVLVLDATHGDPIYNAPVDTKSLEERLAGCVSEEIKNGHPICIRAHTGRLQHTMMTLSEQISENIEFLTSSKNQKIVPVYEKYMKKSMRDLVTSEYESDDIRDNSYPFIEFKTIPERESVPEASGKSVVFRLGGRRLGSHTTIKQEDNNKKHYNIEFGDHATYSKILDYVEKISPKFVITDSYRSKLGSDLADRITKNLKIDATPRPSIGQN